MPSSRAHQLCAALPFFRLRLGQPGDRLRRSQGARTGGCPIGWLDRLSSQSALGLFLLQPLWERTKTCRRMGWT